MTSQSIDAGIPLLTEIIPGPPPAPATESRSAVILPAAGVVQQVIPADDARPAPPLDPEQLEKLGQEIQERVLQQILERIDFVLEQRVRDSLADVLQTAVDGLATDLRNGLHLSMREAVTRAISVEITKLQTIRK